MQVFIFWLHGLEQERRWMSHTPVGAASKIMGSLSARERDQVTRFELIAEPEDGSSVVFAHCRPRDPEYAQLNERVRLASSR
jgi:hypothetical protein